MKKLAMALLAALALLMCLAACVCPTLAETDEAEWTVLFYLCGSDLESRYGYASLNLSEIACSIAPFSLLGDIIEDYYGGEIEPGAIKHPAAVNVVIQTGGSREWHAQPLGLDIDPRALQRWRYDQNELEFILEETLPIASMADPATLSDFIRWGTGRYPAKKYALVLWGHGGGSKTGIFIDELYKGDMMYIDELGIALRDGAARFEAVLFDACLMANIETACAIADYANWMIASEEVVAGHGTAIAYWLQQLYYDPEADGEWLGRWICDMNAIKYANIQDVAAQQLLTWSVIDLSKIGLVGAALDHMFEVFGEIYAKYPYLMLELTHFINALERYGNDDEDQLDLAGVFYHPDITPIMNGTLRWEMISALKEAVVYSQRGSGRSGARGLSFCYAVDFDCDELESYSRNCPSPHYLAFLDAISPWTAPDWVYEKVARLPEIETLEAYRLTANRLIGPDGTPVIDIYSSDIALTKIVHYNLYRMDGAQNKLVKLGTLPAFFDTWETGREDMPRGMGYRAIEPWNWPAVEGATCCFDLLITEPRIGKRCLGNIPLQIGTEQWNLRCLLDGSDGTETYIAFGLWEGFDSDTRMFDSNVKLLAQMAGQEFKLLFPVQDAESRRTVQYIPGDSRTMYRALEVEEQPLPAGTYYLEYVVYDLFMRPMPLEYIEMRWDGQQAFFPQAEEWRGEIELSIPENYW